MATTTLGNKSTGTLIKLKENGVLVDFYVAKHNYESGLNGNGRTLVVRKDVYDTRVWHNTNVNAYASCDLDAWFNGAYKNMLDADIRGVIGTTKIYYTPGNGNTSVTTLSRSIFALSMTELGQSHTYANTEGSALPIANTLKIAYRNGSAITQWTRSPVTHNTGNAWLLSANGSIGRGSCNGTFGSRPAFTLPSTLSVSDDGTVSVNTAPKITSPTGNGSNLGTKNSGFTLNYTVTDADNDPVTVKEYLDDRLLRSYRPTLGQAQTVQALTPSQYHKVLNGSHTFKVIANDGKANSNEFKVYFSKKVTSATITMAEPLPANDTIKVMVATITGQLPADAVLKVEVTNNANDPSPVWEDATNDVKTGANHVFTNQTASNGFAFNFKVSVSRGPSDTGGHISNIGGAFQ